MVMCMNRVARNRCAHGQAVVCAYQQHDLVCSSLAWFGRHRAVGAAVMVGLFAVAFGLIHDQLPLYSMNQNTYLLHGIAPHVEGLQSDWLAGCADPQPVFSALVGATYAAFGPRALHVYMIVMAALFAACLWIICREVRGPRLAGLAALVSYALFLLVHAGDGRTLGFRMDGLLFRGLAGQYILGPVLQPAVFGVFLLAAVAAALRRRWSLASCVPGC